MGFFDKKQKKAEDANVNIENTVEESEVIDNKTSEEESDSEQKDTSAAEEAKQAELKKKKAAVKKKSKDAYIENVIEDIKRVFSDNNESFLRYKRGDIAIEDFKVSVANIAEDSVRRRGIENADIDKIVETYFKKIEGYDIIDEIIDLFVADNEVGDIKIMDYNKICYSKRGKLYDWNKSFKDRRDYVAFVSRLANKNESNLARINAIQFFLDNKSRKDVVVRVNITTDINDSGVPFVAMRVEPVKKYTREQLIEQGYFTEEIDNFLMEEINKNKSFYWTGGTGSGKTTGMNHYIDRLAWDRDETTLVIQKISELHSENPHFIFQHEIKSNGDNRINFTVRDIAENLFQLGVQRVIIGELVGAEALEMVNCVYGGTPGWASGHGSSARDGIEKWVHNAKVASDYKREDLLRMLSKINYVIYAEKFSIKEIYRIDGYDEEKKELVFTPIAVEGRLVTNEQNN